MIHPAHPHVAWRKSSYSGHTGGDCVEVGWLTERTTGVRDSKNPTGPVLSFTARSWQAFVATVRDGGLQAPR
ncbi:DUF397 domain-containing protein [Allostreptomyces psammosilenae]|uniref:DUF397 domain-containing protein n=1 Tax=Allostreptomyces psammosilenae TaxID=1892865 RepID=A0A853A2N5_9ACTN|nr:DUF397 domain-containing protein [Allostreptomyces psammosilenae]NYI07730.1 hypothetical protein [Allostreptomyces psammosilenae]